MRTGPEDLGEMRQAPGILGGLESQAGPDGAAVWKAQKEGGSCHGHCPRTHIYLLASRDGLLGQGAPTTCLPHTKVALLEVSMLLGKIYNLMLHSVGLERIPFCYREPPSNASI